jgi:tetratricopeptide (TPR) repeat protein
MTPRTGWFAGLVVVLAACSGVSQVHDIEGAHVTTAGAIAVANLDHQIAQRRDDPDAGELLLARSRFLADYEALDRASTVAEARFATAGELVQRARTRGAVHRFADALADVAAAERAGANGDELAGLRASIFVAIGRADEVVAQLEAGVARRPGFSSRSALANAYAAVGRFNDADHMYVAALADLDTTSPFPYAWIYFARGMMWAEHAGDPARGEAMYVRALRHLPEFATANIHLAELEVARGDLASSMARLERVVASSSEPEALALLGALHVRTGDPVRGRREIARAGQVFESLLARHPLAFADHAAEFYLGPGADPERAWLLAAQNLAGRETDRAIALAIQAARATGRHREACALVARARAKSIVVRAASEIAETCRG